VLPALLLRAVRCERCYRRRYVFRAIPMLDRVQIKHKPPTSQPSDKLTSTSRVA
jgi:hypothetical protein